MSHQAILRCLRLRRNCTLVLCVVVITLSSFCQRASGQADDVDAERDFAANVERLLDPKSTSKEADRVVVNYRRTANAIHAALQVCVRENRKFPTQLVRAVGELQLTECSRFLADQIDLEADAAFEDGPLTNYPAAEALVELGSRSYGSLFARLEHKANERQLRIVACTCIQIDGEKLALFRFQDRLGEHVAKLKFPGVDDDLAANLRRLCEIIRTVDFKKPENWP